MNTARVSSLLGFSVLAAVVAQGATNFSTPVTLTQGGAAPGPTLTGGVLTVTTAANGQNNVAAFDVSDPGARPGASFAFGFRISAPVTPSADGFSFMFANTTPHGTSGNVAIPQGEEPNVAGVLGFAFDTWNNDTDPGPDNSDLQQIALHYNGGLVTAVDDTRLLGTPLTLDDGALHSVTGFADFAGGTVSLSVDGQSIFNNVAVPGLTSMESRIAFAGRTGGENELVEITDLNVSFVPEPGSVILGLLGTALIFRRRRL
ncbi:MAG: lectin-like domain-containing protein [Verrucomicrobiales bacterium]